MGNIQGAICGRGWQTLFCCKGENFLNIFRVENGGRGITINYIDGPREQPENKETEKNYILYHLDIIMSSHFQNHCSISKHISYEINKQVKQLSPMPFDDKWNINNQWVFHV